MISDVTTARSMDPEAFEPSDAVSNQAFGFWIYLMTDLVLFSAIFATYAVLSRSHAGGPSGKELFNLYYTFGETMFLLCSSATCGLAVLAIKEDRKGQVMTWLTVTFLLGAAFIAMEVNEFRHMIVEGSGPGRSAFLSAFFTLVGTHGAHVSVGLIWMAVMFGQVLIKGLSTPVQSRLMRLSLFWHFLDIVWIGIFTLVYLKEVV